MIVSKNPHEKPRNDVKDIDVVMLCGGSGKRLRGVVNDRPKCMAEIGDNPFLDTLLGYVVQFGFRRFVLCTGYMSDFIKQYYRNKDSPAEILFSEEHEPMGTAGAIKNARMLIKSSPFLVMNADSFCEIDLIRFYDFHKEKCAMCSLALTNNIKGPDEYGEVVLDERGQVTAFYEKNRSNRYGAFINAGIYMLERKALSLIPLGESFSLEYDLFPKMIKEGIFGYKTNGAFVDIGTPQGLKLANNILTDSFRVNND